MLVCLHMCVNAYVYMHVCMWLYMCVYVHVYVGGGVYCLALCSGAELSGPFTDCL